MAAHPPEERGRKRKAGPEGGTPKSFKVRPVQFSYEYTRVACAAIPSQSFESSRNGCTAKRSTQESTPRRAARVGGKVYRWGLNTAPRVSTASKHLGSLAWPIIASIVGTVCCSRA